MKKKYGTMHFLSKKKADVFANKMRNLGFSINRKVRKPYGEKVYHVTWKGRKKRK